MGWSSNKTPLINSNFYSINNSAAPLPPGWNHLLESDNTICADDKNSYFIRIFVANVTSIDCLLEGNSTAGIVQAVKFSVFFLFEIWNFRAITSQTRYITIFSLENSILLFTLEFIHAMAPIKWDLIWDRKLWSIENDEDL